MKNILITGVCGGMGKATANYLARQGYHIIGIDKAKTCDLNIDYYSVDLTKQEEISNAFSLVCQKVKTLDCIIHFAGFYTMNSLVEIDDASMRKIFDVNFFGIYRINKTFLPLMSKGSKIIITSSELAPLDPLPFTGLYAITKSTVEKYAFSLRMELNLLGINVSLIRPGAVKTNMLGESTSAIDNFINNTELYKETSTKFKKIVDSVETKNIPAEKIAKLAHKIVKARRPKYVYNINRNFLLKLLNILPDRLQVFVIGKLLKSKDND